MRFKKIRRLALISVFALFSGFSFAGEKGKDVIVENSYQIVNISKTDLNRIYCKEGITYYRYSKEKYVKIYLDEDRKNAFVKIIPKIVKIGNGIEEKIIYDQSPKDVFIKCGNKMYSLLLKPLPIYPVTIVLKGTGKKPSSNLSSASEVPSVQNGPVVEKKYDPRKAEKVYGKSDSYVSVMTFLVRLALKKGEIPGYETFRYYKPVKEFKQGSLIRLKSFVGPEYAVTLYAFIANEDIYKPLREKDFAFLSEKPLAISIEDLVLREGQTTHIVVIEPSSVFKK